MCTPLVNVHYTECRNGEKLHVSLYLFGVNFVRGDIVRGRVCIGNGRVCIDRGRVCIGRGRVCIGRGQVCQGETLDFVRGDFAERRDDQHPLKIM